MCEGKDCAVASVRKSPFDREKIGLRLGLGDVDGMILIERKFDVLFPVLLYNALHFSFVDDDPIIVGGRKFRPH